MSVVASGTQFYTRASFFPASTSSFTIMGKVFIVTNVTAPQTGQYQNIAGMNSSIVCGLHWNSTASEPRWFITTLNGDFDSGPSYQPETGKWYDFAFVRNGTIKTFYINGLAVVSVDDTSAGDTGLVLADYDGVNNDDELLGKLAGIKIWSVALSPQELFTERYNVFPSVQLSAVLGVYPIFGIRSDELDFSGHSRTLTVTGTFTTDVKPPNLELYVPRVDDIVDVPASLASSWPGYYSSRGMWF